MACQLITYEALDTTIVLLNVNVSSPYVCALFGVEWQYYDAGGINVFD